MQCFIECKTEINIQLLSYLENDGGMESEEQIKAIYTT